MGATEQVGRGQAVDGQDSGRWPGVRVSVTGLALEGAEEIDLLPDFERLLHGGPQEEWCVPRPEGLLG